MSSEAHSRNVPNRHITTEDEELNCSSPDLEIIEDSFPRDNIVGISGLEALQAYEQSYSPISLLEPNTETVEEEEDFLYGDSGSLPVENILEKNKCEDKSSRKAHYNGQHKELASDAENEKNDISEISVVKYVNKSNTSIVGKKRIETIVLDDTPSPPNFISDALTKDDNELSYSNSKSINTVNKKAIKSRSQYSKTTKKSMVVQHKNSHSRSRWIDRSKSFEKVQRHVPKKCFEKINDINCYLERSSRKRSHSPKHRNEQDNSSYKRSRYKFPSRNSSSPYESSSISSHHSRSVSVESYSRDCSPINASSPTDSSKIKSSEHTRSVSFEFCSRFHAPRKYPKHNSPCNDHKHSRKKDMYPQGKENEKKSPVKPKDKIERSKFETNYTENECILDNYDKVFPKNVPEVCDVQNKAPEKESVTIIDELRNILSKFRKNESDFMTAVFKAAQSISESEGSVPMRLPSVLENITDTMPNEPQPPQMSCPQIYPVMTSMPVSFTGPVNNYPPIMAFPVRPPIRQNPFPMQAPSEPHVFQAPSHNLYPSATFSAPYIPPAIHNPPEDFSANIVEDRGPTTLRSIPIVNNESTTSISRREQPDKLTSLKPIELPLKRKENEMIEKVSSRKVCRYELQDNCSQLIEDYKKLTSKRHFTHTKVRKMSNDLIQINHLIEETWGKKPLNSTEKETYAACKNLQDQAHDLMKIHTNYAKYADQELGKLMENMPTEIRAKVATFKTEDCLICPPSSSVKYNIYDSGNHTCPSCDLEFSSTMNVMEHLHSAEHKETESSQSDWLEEFREKPSKKEDNPDLECKPVSGVEFIKPIYGFFCTICTGFCLDITDAEKHLKSTDHFIKFEQYLEDNPLYHIKCQVKRLISKSLKVNISNDDKKNNEIVKKRLHVQKIEHNIETDTQSSTLSKSDFFDVKENVIPAEKNKSSKDNELEVIYVGKTSNCAPSSEKELKVNILSLPLKQSPSSSCSSSPEILSSKFDSSELTVGQISNPPASKKETVDTCLTEEESSKIMVEAANTDNNERF